MSTVSKPTPEESPGPGTPPRASSRGKHLAWLGVLGVAALLAYQFLLSPKPAEEATPAATIRTAEVTSGPLEKVIRIGGVTSSIVFTNVVAPRQRGGERRSLILLELKPAGARVKKGEVIARIDGQGLKDHIDDVQSTVLTSEADIKKRRAEQQVSWSNLNQNLRVAQANADKWKVESKAAEIRTVIDQELLSLGVEESEATYQQQEKDLGLEKKVNNAELGILELTTERHKRHVGRHIYDLRRYTVESPMDGMVVRQQIFRNGEFGMVEVGDRLFPGMLFAKVMDTDNMQVEATINQAESNLLKIGMEARVGLDAFPEIHLKGKVYSIGALAKSSTQSPYVRTLPVRVRIEGTNEMLIPDLSAYADVVIDRVENAIQVPDGAVFEEAGQAYVYVKQGESFDKRPVRLGLRNFTHVAILDGLEVGSVVALDRPESPI